MHTNNMMIPPTNKQTRSTCSTTSTTCLDDRCILRVAHQWGSFVGEIESANIELCALRGQSVF